MTAPRSPEYELLLKNLTHEWIDFEDFVAFHGPKIPPGTALRKYQERNAKSAARYKSDNPRPSFSEERAIESGRRTLLMIALRSGLGSGLIEDRLSPNGGREIRLNAFTAEYIDALLAKLGTHVPEQKKEEKVEIPLSSTPVVSALPQLMFDQKNVKRDIEVHHNKSAGTVVMIVKEVVDEHDLVMMFTTTASDWLSDQLGMQAMFIRGGRENPEKVFRT